MRTPPRVMPALVTPFDAEGAVDLDAHATNVAVLGDRGIGGFVLGGSTGEGPYLEAGERRALTSATREAAPEAFLLTGVAAESLRLAVAMSAEAAEAGADAVLAMTPTTLVRHRSSLVAGFYRSLAESIELPVFLYSVPRVTGYELPMESATDLAAETGIVGMKDSGGDHVRAATIAASTDDGFYMFVGASAAVSPGVAGGAFGAITASANYAPELVADVVAAAAAGNGDADAHERLTRLSGEVEQHGVPGVKAAAAATGLITGSPRRPLVPLQGEPLREVIEAVATAAPS